MPLAALGPRVHVETEWELDPTATSGTEKWRRVTHLVREFRIRRGRNHELERMETGTLSIRLDNTDRRFETGYAGSLVNELTNPSLEGVSTPEGGWTDVGGSLGFATSNGVIIGPRTWRLRRASDAAPQAGDGVRIVNDDGTRPPVTGLQVRTASIHVCPAGSGHTVKLQLLEYDSGGSLIRTTDSATVAVTSNIITRVSVTVTTLSNAASVALQLVVVTGGSGVVHVDAAQLEVGVLTAYVDGDRDNGHWEGTVNSSRSFRGAPYYPNVRPMRRIRVIATHGNPVRDSGLETVPVAGGVDPEAATTESQAWLVTGNGTVARVTTPAPVDGTYAYQGTAGADTLASVLSLNYYRIPVDEGETVTVSCSFRKPVAGANPSSYLSAQFVDNSGAQVGSGETTSPIDPPTGSWQRESLTTTVPQGATYLKILVRPVGGAAAGTIAYADAVQVDFGALTDYVQGNGPSTLFRGFIQRFPQQSNSYKRGETTVDAVDAMAVLAAGEYVGSPPSEGSAARIGRVLDDITWPTALRKLDAGAITLVAGTALKTPHLTYALDVAETEEGLFFIDGPGYAVLHSKTHRTTNVRSTISQATFGDGGGDPGALPGNLIANDGFEIDTTGWTPSAPFTRDTTEKKYGVASLKVVTPGADWNEYISNTTVVTTAGVPYYAAAWVKGPAGARLYMNLYDSTGVDHAKTDFVCTGEWQYVQTPIQVAAGSGASLILYFATENAPPAQAVTFYVDGVHVEANALSVELPFLPSILPDQDVQRVVNEVKATRTGGAEQTASDATSQDQYFIRSRSYATLHSTDAAALTFAQNMLARLKDPDLELERLDIEPARLAALWPVALALEISDRVTVNRRSQGLELRTFVAFIEAIEHHCVIEQDRIRWRAGFNLSPV